MPQLFFRPKYVWFPIHLKGPMIPDPSGQLAELIVYITSTRVDLNSHQILLKTIENMKPLTNLSYIKTMVDWTYLWFIVDFNGFVSYRYDDWIFRRWPFHNHYQTNECSGSDSIVSQEYCNLTIKTKEWAQDKRQYDNIMSYV